MAEPTDRKLALLQLLRDSLAAGKIDPCPGQALLTAVRGLDAAWESLCKRLMRAVRGVTTIAVDQEQKHIAEAQTLQGRPLAVASNPAQN
jgi:hypothetical protein